MKQELRNIKEAAERIKWFTLPDLIEELEAFDVEANVDFDPIERVLDFLRELDLAFGSLVTVAELVALQRERDQLRAALRIAITTFDELPISSRLHDPIDDHVESAMIRIGDLGICLTDFSDVAEQEVSR